MRPDLADRLSHGLPFVTAKVVHDHDIAWLECRDEDLLDVSLERRAVHGAVQDERRVDPVVAQGCDKGHGAPVPVWRSANQALAFRRPATQRGHVGFRPGFVDEDEAARVDPALIPHPARAAAAHIGTVLLVRQLGLFLNV